MKTSPSASPLSFIPLAPITASRGTLREKVQARTRELARLAGRPAEVSQPDYEQAKRELTGESDQSRQDALLDAPPTLGR